MLIHKDPRSDKQIAASQSNGRKSRGPITPEGKRRSSLNGLKHGFLAQAVLLPGESREKFTRLCDAILAEFLPQSLVEIQFLETMIVARWRQMRLWGFEKVGIANQVVTAREGGDGVGTSHITRAAAAIETLAARSCWFREMSVYEARCDRQYARAMDALRRHRAWRAAELKNTVNEPDIL